jgi:hypothetical protein
MDSQPLALGVRRGLEGLLQQCRDEAAGGVSYQQHRPRPGFERAVDAAVQDGRPRSRGRAVSLDREGAGSSAVQLAGDGGHSRRRSGYSQRKAVRPRLVVSRHVRADEDKTSASMPARTNKIFRLPGEKTTFAAAGLTPSAPATRLRRWPLPPARRMCAPNARPVRRGCPHLRLMRALAALRAPAQGRASADVADTRR